MSEVSHLQALEHQLVGAALLVERRQMVARLRQNPDFRKLILDGFCLHDAARYVQESADPALPAENRDDALNMAQASGHLLRFLSVTEMMGVHSERTMPDLHAAIEDERLESQGEDD